MSNDTKFIDGLIVKAPNERAPEYVKARLSIKREELMAWLAQQSGEWINADVKVAQSGKWYAAVDDWKPPSASTANGGTRTATAGRPQPSGRGKAPAEAVNTDDEIPF